MIDQSEEHTLSPSTAQDEIKCDDLAINKVMIKAMFAVSIPNAIFIISDIINGSDFSIANLVVSDILLVAQFAFLICYLNIINNKILIQQSGSQGLGVWGYFWRANTVYIASVCSAMFICVGFGNGSAPTPSVTFSAIMSGIIFLASVFYAWLFFSRDRRTHLLWALRIIS